MSTRLYLQERILEKFRWQVRQTDSVSRWVIKRIWKRSNINSIELSTAKQCEANEKFSSCGNRCHEPTCDNSSPDQTRCARACVGSCYCAKGFVRDKKSGKCVEPSMCPKKCPANQEYSQCANPCPSTCDHPGPFYCKAMCRPGCACKEGYVVNDQGNCVKPSQCPGKVNSWWYEIWTKEAELSERVYNLVILYILA